MNSKKLMNIFTQSKLNQESKPKTDVYKEILDSIRLTGTATAEIKVIIGADSSQLLDYSAGIPRLRRSLANKFNLIISKPDDISEGETIRCCLCKKVIFNTHYPVWYYSIKYVASYFHYFICFDASSPDKPSTKCYRRS